MISCLQKRKKMGQNKVNKGAKKCDKVTRQSMWQDRQVTESGSTVAANPLTDNIGAAHLLTHCCVGERSVTLMSPTACWQLTRETTTWTSRKGVLNIPYRGPRQITSRGDDLDNFTSALVCTCMVAGPYRHNPLAIPLLPFF